MIKWLQDFFENICRKKPSREKSGDPKHESEQPVPTVHYNSIIIVDKTPGNDAVRKNDFIIVIYQNKPLWTLFQCPCGCRKVISLSLQSVHKPHWTVRKNTSGRPTLHPSVWQNQDCCSHFWIKDGRVYWCNNTGIEPWVAKPQHYSKRSRPDQYV
ncbi:DUF6527 family protein [Desulfocastanea catecholica]